MGGGWGRRGRRRWRGRRGWGDERIVRFDEVHPSVLVRYQDVPPRVVERDLTRNAAYRNQADGLGAFPVEHLHRAREHQADVDVLAVIAERESLTTARQRNARNRSARE